MVYILLAPGFEEAEALVPADLLRRAGIQTSLVSLQGDTVVGSHQITVKADMELGQVELSQAQMVVLPGGGVGVQNLGSCKGVETLVREAYDRHIPLAAICAAPTLLGRWGLLAGKRALCYPGMEDGLTGAQVVTGAKAAVDGNLVTGLAAGAAFDFGLKLVELLAGAEQAEKVRHAVHY
jgi:4-methyl-5(b-hydroxyethyl)-thiazole monophosphate biosynthesis